MTDIEGPRFSWGKKTEYHDELIEFAMPLVDAEMQLIEIEQPTLFDDTIELPAVRIDADQASAQSSAVATRADSSEWSTVLVNRAGTELDEIDDHANFRRIELDRWFTTRVVDAFETFSGVVLAGVLEQLTMAAEVGLYAIETEAVEKIARRAVRA